MHLRHSFERLTMLKFLSLFGLLALTAACANSPTTKQPAAGKCVAEAAQALVGSQGLSTAQIMQRTGATEVRHLRPNDAATADYRDMRISVITDPATQKVIHASCG